MGDKPGFLLPDPATVPLGALREPEKRKQGNELDLTRAIAFIKLFPPNTARGNPWIFPFPQWFQKAQPRPSRHFKFSSRAVESPPPIDRPPLSETEKQIPGELCIQQTGNTNKNSNDIHHHIDTLRGSYRVSKHGLNSCNRKTTKSIERDTITEFCPATSPTP